MNQVSPAITIAALDLQPLAEAETTLEARLRAAMGGARDHWLVTDNEDRFKAAVGAVLLISDEADRERLTTEMRLLGGMSALMNGLPVDVGAMIPDGFEPIGLLKMWSDARRASRE